MIVLLVLGIVLLLYTLLQYAQHKSIHWVPLTVGIVLIVLNLWGLKVADKQNLFMTKQTDSKTEKISPAVELGSYKFITTEKVDKHLRYTYQLNKKSYQTLAEGTHMTIKRGSPATLKTSLTGYAAHDAFERFMLLGQSTKHQTKTDYTMTIPKSWHIVSMDQYQQLAKLVKGTDKNITKNVAKRVKAEYQVHYQKNHKFLKDKKAQKAVQDKIVKEETQKSEDAMNKKIAKQLKAWHVN